MINFIYGWLLNDYLYCGKNLALLLSIDEYVYPVRVALPVCKLCDLERVATDKVIEYYIFIIRRDFEIVKGRFKIEFKLLLIVFPDGESTARPLGGGALFLPVDLKNDVWIHLPEEVQISDEDCLENLNMKSAILLTSMGLFRRNSFSTKHIY